MKDIGVSILATVLGISAGVLAFMPMTFISYIVAGLFDFSDSLYPYIAIYIAMLFSIFICCFLGGYLTGLLTVNKHWIYSSITGIAFILIYSLSGDYRFNDNLFYSIALIIISMATLSGTYCANKFHKQPEV